MATPNEKLAESLEVLKDLQDRNITAIKTDELSRVHRERLVKNNFIKEVVKGWYIVIPEHETPGDSTSWYASYWHFCSRYLGERYGKNYYLSPEQSLLLHAGNWTVPIQLIVRSDEGSNSQTPLPFNTSLFSMKLSLPKSAEIEEINGLLSLNLPSSLIHSSATIFTSNPTDARTALSLIRDSSDISRLLLEGGHSTIAGRLIGAFRNIGYNKIADEIIKTMVAAGYEVRETDPFQNATPVALSSREKSPYVNRIKLMWESMRSNVIEHFPKAPGIPKNIDNYLKQVEEIYVTDAYHSLSIEKYRVTPELIERVRSGQWDTLNNKEDKKQRDAMAARGYWQAREKVKNSIIQILKGENAGTVMDNDHGDWYRELFAPSVAAGILKTVDLAGYRNDQVYIGGSKHVPLNKEAVRDVMPLLFELLQNEKEPSVRAVLGHFVFVFIHPYMDGNGRMGRFLLNTMLASGGYPWTVIPKEERDAYMESLEKASVGQDIEPFTKFIASLVTKSIEGAPVATVATDKSEFPPYKFFKTQTEIKSETWRIPVDDSFSALRLHNFSITPMDARHALSLEVVIDSESGRTSQHFNLSTLFYNKNLPHHLFFVDQKNKHVDIIFPKGRKRITLKINLLEPVAKFEVLLACEYIR